jgi:ankyrin repeat protein
MKKRKPGFIVNIVPERHMIFINMVNLGENELHQACKNARLADVEELLRTLEALDLTDEENSDGFLPLHVACKNTVRNILKDIVEKLL